MTLRKKALWAVHVAYGLVVVLFAIDVFTPVDIKASALKTAVYYGFMIGAPLTLIASILLSASWVSRIGGSVLPIAVVVWVFSLVPLALGPFFSGPLLLMFHSSSWQTQTILYKHRRQSRVTVEYQMLDIGAFGYRKRTVVVEYFTPLFIYTRPWLNDSAAIEDWRRVNVYVNELGLKGG